MKFNKKFFINIGLAFVVSTVVVSLSYQGMFKRIEAAGSDFLFRLRGFSSYNPGIVVIQITDENLQDAGRWPWPRRWHATLTKALKDLGADKIYFDIIFSEPSDNYEDDIVFAQAIEYAGNVYLPFAFREREISPGTALYPLEIFRDRIKGTGSINIYPEIDGIMRKIPIFFAENDVLYPHIALKLAMDIKNMSVSGIEKDRLILSGEDDQIVIPLVDGNKVPINWRGKWQETFTHYSYLDILVAYKDLIEGNKPDIDLTPISGSICLVGATAVGLYDIRPTPIEAEYPGVGAITTVISTILDDELITPAHRSINLLLIYLLGLAPFLFISGEKSLREILLVLLTSVFFFFMVVRLFRMDYQVNYVLPLLSLVASYTAVATFHFIRVSMERQKYMQLAITDGLTGLANIRYFKILLNAEFTMAKRDPDGRGFCVLMTDIDHFKKFNDTYGHAIGDLVLKEAANVLRSSTRSSDLVARYGGEEMIVLLRNTPLENAMLVGEKLRKSLEDHTVRDPKNIYKVTMSVGVSEFGPDDDNIDTVIKRADEALYKAKKNGRNRVETLETTL